ncbi:MAG: sigma-70 family RNA polymerase sigma factor [Candidatus Anammoximicrobium sp.]|nr:sigma-70 family RNA polymerase sigma factor [Candidatus Anammoximicrobium sp.]
MALLEFDRKLLRRCLNRESQAWEAFVDRFLGLVLHVVRHTAKSRSIRLSPQDEEDLVAEFFLTVVRNDFATLRQFRAESSLATYLTVVARRVVVREMLKRFSGPRANEVAEPHDPYSPAPRADFASAETQLSNREEVERLMHGLTESEAEVVRLYHLEGKTYREISSAVGIPENSIGPTLNRARAKMRQAMADSSV